MQENWQQVGVGKERSGQECKYEHGGNCADNYTDNKQHVDN
jgi:hypothetical protein